MPILIQFTPLYTSKATVDVSSLINSLRVQSRPESQRLADSLEQLQSIIHVLIRSLRAGVQIAGDDILLTEPGGVPGSQMTAAYVNAGSEFKIGGVSAVMSGNGTPEGAVTAPVGTLFLRRDGGAGTSLYVKEAGAGNTGWVGK